MVRRWLVVAVVLVALWGDSCAFAPPVITATVAPNTTATGDTGGVVTINGSGFGAHDSLSVGLVDVPDLQGSTAAHQYAGPWPTTADSSGKLALAIHYGDCAPSPDIAGVSLRAFANDRSNQTSTSVLVPVSKFCNSNTAVPEHFTVAS
jgi:hypothetical protein